MAEQNVMCAFIATLSICTASAGTWSAVNLKTDQDTGISPDKTYTHLVDFGPAPTTAAINGVRFTAKGRTAQSYSLSGAPMNYTGYSSGLSGGLGTLLSDFFFTDPAAAEIQVLKLSGLKPANNYRLSLFVGGWDAAPEDIEASDNSGVHTLITRDGSRLGGDSVHMRPTGAGEPGAMLVYQYVAPKDGTLIMRFTMAGGGSFHQYGFANELDTNPPFHRARATAEVSNGFVFNVSMDDVGGGYKELPDVQLIGGGGSGAKVQAELVNGCVTNINVVDVGRNYTSAPLVVIASPPFPTSLEVAVSRIRVTQHVNVGKTYVLEASKDFSLWSSVGGEFTPLEEVFVTEVEVTDLRAFYRLKEVR